MTSFDPVHAISTSVVPSASIVPFDPTVAIAVVASVVLVAIVAFMVYLSFAPMAVDSWADDAEAHGHPSEPDNAD